MNNILLLVFFSLFFLTNALAADMVEFRLVCENNVEGCEAFVNPQKQTVWVGKDVLLSSADIRKADYIKQELSEDELRHWKNMGVPAINPVSYKIALQFTEGGAEKLARVTRENVEQHLAIILDGNLIMTPRIMESITSGRIHIDGSDEKTSQSIVNKINAVSGQR